MNSTRASSSPTTPTTTPMSRRDKMSESMSSIMSNISIKGKSRRNKSASFQHKEEEGGGGGGGGDLKGGVGGEHKGGGGGPSLRVRALGTPPRRRRSLRYLTEEELRTAGKDSFQKAWATINSSDWKLEKKTSHGDLVHSKPGTKTPKIYRLTSEVDVAPEILFKEIYYNLENLPTWNSAITHSKLLQKVDASTDVCYQVAAEGPGGVVTARDFVNVRHWEKVGDCWVSSGVSVPHPDMPPQKKMVRGENGPGCWVFGPVANNPNKCTFKWLLDTDLKGWIPQYVLDQALTHAMIEYINSIRKYTPTILRKYTLEQQQQDDS